jgi:hypothetical protein
MPHRKKPTSIADAAVNAATGDTVAIRKRPPRARSQRKMATPTKASGAAMAEAAEEESYVPAKALTPGRGRHGHGRRGRRPRPDKGADARYEAATGEATEEEVEAPTVAACANAVNDAATGEAHVPLNIHVMSL